ncbi:efflux RND transporter periplasmic adaptor subunit [Thiohalocapsa sp.]|jgi:RND family efflux transporter MFP subunit|uniref:efflux RND transporter periplasmic adaptor subunit n=1 Tax=Thiohalocapsa sp. TaxID=2497641 RepID=UPI002600C4C3|nr:efflux RND transporter periplasmic adaptor subunit [Thiohalocapsa sp.]
MSMTCPRPTSPTLLTALLLGIASLVAAEPAPVTLAEVQREVLREQAVLSGTTIARRRAALSPKVDGLVTELFVDAGSRVAAGDPVLVLDDRLEAHNVEAAAARVQEAEASHQDAIRIRDELLRLKEGRHASETDIRSAIARVDMTAAALAAEQAALAQAREVKRRHRLTAPFAGMIVSRNVEVGEWAKRDEAAVELVALDVLRIRATLPQTDFPRVARGASAAVRFDALPERTFRGEVFARVASGDPRSRTFPILIDLPNPDGLLAPGMSARVRVSLAGGEAEVLTVPRDAVVAKADGSREVWRVQEEDGLLKAYPVAVEIGRAGGDRLEVTAGELADGDRVVLLGNESLKPGQTIAPQPTERTPDAAETAALK